MFKSGKIYTVTHLSRDHRLWEGVQAAITRRAKPGVGRLVLEELYDVRWRDKPFPWSWSREFKPGRRLFYHGTSRKIIQRILDDGFRIVSTARAKHGRMLGDGVYATYHTNKGQAYGTDGYVLSVMVYAPNALVVQPGQTINLAEIQKAAQSCDAIEVRTGAVVRGRRIRNHEICVFDPQRVVPRFILKIS